MKKTIVSSVILHHGCCCQRNQNKCQHDTRPCVVLNVSFLIKVYMHICYPGVISIWKNSKIKAKMLKIEILVKNKITYKKHIKIQWVHMDVIFMPKHLICQSLQCTHILSLIMHCQTRNVWCDAVLTVHVSILPTKKYIISIHAQHHQYGFTFST